LKYILNILIFSTLKVNIDSFIIVLLFISHNNMILICRYIKDMTA